MPSNLFEQINQHLSFEQSRSKFIANAIEGYFTHQTSLDEWMPIELVEHLQYQFVKDSPEDVLIQSLLQILAK